MLFNTLPVFGFNSAKSDINLIKSYLLPLLVNERQIEPTVLKKAHLFVSFNFDGETRLPVTLKMKKRRICLFQCPLMTWKHCAESSS